MDAGDGRERPSGKSTGPRAPVEGTPVEQATGTEHTDAEQTEPSLEEVAAALEQHVTADGSVGPGVVAELSAKRGWSGRVIEVLAILNEDTARMGYLAGGSKPDEVMASLNLWASSPLSIEEIRTVVASGGWEPEPFVVVARNGLLESFVHRPDGSMRRIRGELAGAWLSDQCALAEDDEILREVRRIVEGDEP